MDIRKANPADMKRILDIYEYARGFMVKTGNPHQWAREGYPQKALLESDIEKGQLYVMEDRKGIHGVFAFPIGPDPTYRIIKDGAWLNDNPYGTIHRIAGDGTVSGLLERCLSFCFTLTDTVRIDTHHDNKVMQHVIEKNGFTYCGIIFAADGSPRLAYQRGRIGDAEKK